MKNPNLMSDNDYKRISKALQAQKEDSITMTLGEYTITVNELLSNVILKMQKPVHKTSDIMTTQWKGEV